MPAPTIIVTTGDVRVVCSACGSKALHAGPDALDDAIDWMTSHRTPRLSAVQILTDKGTLIGWATP